MSKKQSHLNDIHDNGSYGDSKSLNESNNEEDKPSPSLTSDSQTNSNVDHLLLKNLVEIVPLVESLMDQKEKSSFTRRSSLIYTKAPSRLSETKKVAVPKGKKNETQPLPPKKHRDCLCEDRKKIKNVRKDELPISRTRALAIAKDREELIILQEQVKNLQKELLEKDELLKLAEIEMNHMAGTQAHFEGVKDQIKEKESLIESTNMKHYDAKVKLEEKQATLERLQLEATKSNRTIETLQKNLDSTQGELSTFMQMLEILEESKSTSDVFLFDTTPNDLDLPHIDDTDEIDMQQMEEARKAYIVAVTAAKENEDEESFILAAKVRLHLQSFVFGPKKTCSGDTTLHGLPFLALDMVS